MGKERFHEYLGDAVYVFLDPYGGVVLRTSDGVRDTNKIVLEPEVIQKLYSWVDRTKKELAAQMELPSSG